MKNQNFSGNELARDFLGIASIPFFVLVLIRVWFLGNLPYFTQFIISGVLFLICFFLLKVNLYSGMGLIVAFFTQLYYAENLYTLFASFAYLGLICSLIYLKYEWKKIIFGFISGIISAGISYYLVKIIF